MHKVNNFLLQHNKKVFYYFKVPLPAHSKFNAFKIVISILSETSSLYLLYKYCLMKMT